MSDLTKFPVALIGGLQDSKAKAEPTDFQELTNFTVFRGRFALRAPMFQAVDLSSILINITHVLTGAFHAGKMFALVYRDVNDDVRLVEMNADGSSPVDRGAVWTAVLVAPRPVMASFEGGALATPINRLYITDYDGQQITRFWDGTAIQTLQVDFDNSGTPEDVKFHYVSAYQFHLWGAGFLQSAVARNELLRFSQPGLIPADDPDGQGASLVEWWINDFRPVGRRGDKVTNLSFAGGNMIVFKNRQAYALFGYDSESWAIRLLTERAGAVGPYAAAATGDGLCFFWSERGPHMTDGNQIVDISEPVRKHVLEASVSDLGTVEFSQDDGLVYFGYPKGGSAVPDHWLAYDKERGLFVEGDWLKTGGTPVQIRRLVSVPSDALPGPIGAPSSLAAAPVTDTRIDLSWTNTDIALDTITEVYRDTVSPATTKIAEVKSGINAYQDTGVVWGATTTYFYRLRHKRNGVFSGFSNEDSEKPKLPAPADFALQRLSTGVRVTLTNNVASADIEIERAEEEIAQTSTGLFIFTGEFTKITTLLNQTTGAKTFDDTTTVAERVYVYRSRTVKAGETTSAYTAEKKMVAGLVLTLTAASHQVFLGQDCASFGSRVAISWSGTGAQPEDKVRISVNDNGGGYVVHNTVPLTNFAYQYWWALVVSGGVSRTIQFKLEALSSAEQVESTLETTLSSHMTQQCSLLG